MATQGNCGNSDLDQNGKPYTKASLTDGEKAGITIPDGEIEKAKERVNNCLVGKYWSEKKYNKRVFKSVLTRIWRVERVNFRDLHDNIWLIEFSDLEDKHRVMDGRPWSFDHQLLVL